MAFQALSSGPPSSNPFRHDVFISYATVASGRIGAALENGLTYFGRPWDAPSALDVYRDVSDQPATTDLAGDLLLHLDGSRWFVLLASPAAAASRWVGLEVEHWLTTQGTERLFMVLVDGDLTWDSHVGSFDAQRSSALVPALLKELRVVPKWVDLRWTAGADFDADDERFFYAVADLSAAIRGVRKEELVSAHWREYDRGLSRRLAQQATLAVENDTELGLLLAAAAVDIDACPENCLALADVLEATASIVATVASHGEVTTITATPDGENLLAGYEDGAVLTWRPCSGAVIDRICPRAGKVSALAQAPDSATLAIGYSDGEVVVVDGDRHWSTSIGDLPVIAVAVTADAQSLVASTGTALALWNVGHDTLMCVDREFIQVGALRLVPAGVRIYDWGELFFVDPTTGAVRSEGRLPTLPRPGPRALDITGEFAVLAQLDGGGVSTWRVGPAQPTDIDFFQGPPGLADAIAIAPGADSVAFATGGELIFWHQDEPGRSVIDRAAVPHGLDMLVLGNGGSWVALKGSARTELRTRRPASLARPVPVLATDVPLVIQAAVSADFDPTGRLLAWVTNPSLGLGDHPTVSIWHVEEFQAGPTLSIGSARAVSFVDDHRVVVTPIQGDTRLIWDLTDNRRSAAPAGEPTDQGPSFGVDYQRHQVVVKDLGEVIDSVDYGTGAVIARMNRSGRLLAVATAAGRLFVRDVEAQMTRWTTPSPWLTDLVFDCPGSLLATITAGGRLLIIDVSTARVAARFGVQASPVHRLVFSADGRHLAVAGVGGQMTVVDTDSRSWRDQARRRAGRSLTSEEVHSFGLDRVYVTDRPRSGT